jgi:phage gpG-like protein
LAGSEKHNFEGLNKLVRAISGPMVVEIGILGKKSVREDGGSNDNAYIGAIHELGSYEKKPVIPARSFLLMPLFHKAEQIKKQTAIGAEKLLAKGDTMGLLRHLGTAAVRAILEAFATRGFGTWAPNTPGTIKHKKHGDSPLIDTGQLRRSISFRVAQK